MSCGCKLLPGTSHESERQCVQRRHLMREHPLDAVASADRLGGVHAQGQHTGVGRQIEPLTACLDVDPVRVIKHLASPECSNASSRLSCSSPPVPRRGGSLCDSSSS